jgi:adenosine deaminase
VHVTINSDDPGMMRFDIADEYAAVWSAFDYSLEDMEQLALGGITASFAPPDEQRALTRRFEAEFDALRREYGLPSRTR